MAFFALALSGVVGVVAGWDFFALVPPSCARFTNPFKSWHYTLHIDGVTFLFFFFVLFFFFDDLDLWNGMYSLEDVGLVGHCGK